MAVGKMYTGEEGVPIMEMTSEELDRKCDLMEQALDALLARDRKRMLELTKDIITMEDAFWATLQFENDFDRGFGL